MKNIVLTLVMGMASFLSSGCGVYLAFTQPPPVDTAALEAGGGWSRSAVVERVGIPKSSVVNADGSREEIFEFYEGSSTGWKVGRGIFHLGADIFTLALWEIVATPSEFLIRGDKITAQATFDSTDRLKSFRVLGRETKPLEKIHKQQNGS
ncbi:MAG: hypothetical protein KF751_10580 [Nitrospira sp.]|nr:hypothetical protein [Nitrospira sp.]